MVLAKNGVRNVAVRDELYWTIVVQQLLLGDYVRVVAVHMAIDANYAAHNTRYRAYVVRNHDYCHSLGQVMQQIIELVLKTIVYKVGGLVKDENLGVRNNGS